MSAAPATERRRASGAPLSAYVLHAHDWSETSLILDLFTREEGRVVVAAKGAKRPYSQLRAVLLPFQKVAVQLSRVRTAEAQTGDEVRTLRTAEWAGGSTLVPAPRLLGAFYLNELLMKCLPRAEPQPQLFDLYHDTLAAVATAQSDEDQAAAMRAFELTLLSELGLLPDLAQETLSGAALQAEAAYGLKPELGLVRGGAEGVTLTGAQWVGLQAALLSGHLPALRAAALPHRLALRTVLRELLAYHLGGAPLRTRDVVHALQRLKPVSRPAAAGT